MPSRPPAWLTAALIEAKCDGANVRSADLADLEPGDLWVFQGSHDAPVRRIVLVLDSDVHAGTVTAALVSTEVDFAGDRDIVVDDTATGAGYPLMIQTGFIATLLWARADHRVGMLSNELVDDVVDFIWNDRPGSLETLRGLPWPEPTHERRAAFESEELADLRQLASESDPRFGGSPPKPVAGFAAACEVVASRSADAETYLLGLVNGAIAGTIPHAEFLEEGMLCADVLDALTPAFSATLSDVRALMQPLIDRCLAVQPALHRVKAPDGNDLVLQVWGAVDGTDEMFVVYAPRLMRKYGPVLETTDGKRVLLGGLQDG